MPPPDWLPLVERVLGPAVVLGPLGGGAWQVAAGGTKVVVKSGAGAADEAEGLARLALVAGAPPVPVVLHLATDLLVTAWVEQGERTPAHEEALGRNLAALHAAPWPDWGGGSSWIGACPVDPAVVPDAATFYGSRLLDLARRCGLERSVDTIVPRLGDLLPSGTRPSLLHGDLWWGNVLWGVDGRAWLIDPSVHGGCPEEDVALLGLFGAVPRALLSAYEEVSPQAPGWGERVALLRLYPLLVHTVLFGGGYRAQAEEVIRRFT